MKTRVRLLPNGQYVAEKLSMMIFWSSCYVRQSYDFTYRLYYSTGVEAMNATENYRKDGQAREAAIRELKAAAKAYKVEVVKWAD